MEVISGTITEKGHMNHHNAYLPISVALAQVNSHIKTENYNNNSLRIGSGNIQIKSKEINIIQYES